MELLSSSRPSAGSVVSRRAWLLAPVGVAAVGAWWLTRQRALPDASESGTGDIVTIRLFADDGRQLGLIQVRKIAKPLEEWRRELGAEAFAVTRQQGTEFAFHNLYWDNHKAGIYRCICCGNAVFRSSEKFDSDTGWPSFTAPIAVENVGSRLDRSHGLERVEVVCKKCDGHLGHLFEDGPRPGGHRYCLNSAALRFVGFG